MKKLILIIILFFSIATFGQKVKAEAIRHTEVTTVERDAFVVPVGEYWKIYNTTTNKFEHWNGTIWVSDSTNSLEVKDEGISTVSSATILNFVGSAVTVTDAGAGEATVTIVGGSGESTTVSDTPEIDMTLTGADITSDIVVGSIDVLKLDAGVQSSLGLADSSLQSEVDGSTTNELQNLSWVDGTNTIEISSGTNAIITGFLENEVDGSITNEIQTIDISQLTGTDLELSLSSDGEATKVIDLSPLQDHSVETVVQTAQVNEVAGITVGQILYISGATGGFPEVSLADNTDYSKSDVLAIALETKSDNQQIQVGLLGLMENINTNLFTEGQILYLGTSGSIVTAHPTGLDAVIRIGKAVKINAVSGSILFNIDNLTTVDNVNGFVRNQLVNTSAGTSAIVNTTYVNDANHYLSINMGGSNNSFGASQASLYSTGHGDFQFVNDGNKDFSWFTDVGDTHNLSYTEKMRLTSAGFLTAVNLSGTNTGDNSVNTLYSSLVSFPGFSTLLSDYGYTEPTHSLADLTDVDATVGSPTDGKIMVYRSAGTDWILEDKPVPGGGGATQLDELSDVVSATNTNKFALMANGTTGYVGRALVEADISDFGTYLTSYTEAQTWQDVTALGSTTDQNLTINGTTVLIDDLGSTGEVRLTHDGQAVFKNGDNTEFDFRPSLNRMYYTYQGGSTQTFVYPALTGNSTVTWQDAGGIVALLGDITGTNSGTNTGDNSVNSLYSGLISNVTTNLSEGTSTTTTVDVNSSDGTNATLLSASTIRAGLMTKAKFDEVEINNTKVTNTDSQNFDTAQLNGSNLELSITNDGDALKIINLSSIANNTGVANMTTVFDSGDILWLGTSITEGSSYPASVSTYLGGVSNNQGKGSSPVRIPPLAENPAWQAFTRALSHTTIEKQDIIDNWVLTYRDQLSNSPPTTLSAAQETEILNSSYQVRIEPFLTASEFIFFDHGFNDWYPTTPTNITVVPGTRDDRAYYIGAMNYLMDIIFEDDFRKKVFIIGHYENFTRPGVCDAQEKIANAWGIPYIKIWDKTGLSDEIISGSTVTDNWIPDGVHPYTDGTGKTEQLISNTITKELISHLTTDIGGGGSFGGGDINSDSNFLTDNVIVKSDGTGKKVQYSGVTIDGADNISGILSLTSDKLNIGENSVTNGQINMNKSDGGNTIFQYTAGNYLQSRRSGGGTIAGWSWDDYATNVMLLDLDGDLTILKDMSAVNFIGNGLNLTNVNANMLDTFDSSQFLRSDVNNAFTGTKLTVETELELLSTKDGTWIVGEELASLNWFGSDTSGAGANIKTSIKSLAYNTFGAAFDMVFYTNSGTVESEAMRLNAVGDAIFVGNVTANSFIKSGGTGLNVLLDDGTTTLLSGIGGASPLTTKGDLFTYSTSDVRLPVGTNGQILTADSVEATGLKWTTPAGGGNVSAVNTPVLNDFARFINSTDIEGRSYAETRTDLGLVIGTDVQAFSTVLNNTTASFLLADETNLDNQSGTNTGDNAVNTLYSNLTEQTKSITIESPTATEDISMFFTNKAITITEIRAVVRGSTPSVTWTIRHGTDRSATGSQVVTGGTTTTSVSTGSDVVTFNDATIVLDSFVWFETTAQTGTVDEINLTITYTVD